MRHLAPDCARYRDCLQAAARLRRPRLLGAALRRSGRGVHAVGGRYVAAAAFRIASWASSMSIRTVVSIWTAPVAPTAIASAAADALSGISPRKAPSYSPNVNQKPRSFPPRDSATSRAAALRSCGLLTIAFIASVE